MKKLVPICLIFNLFLAGSTQSAGKDVSSAGASSFCISDYGAVGDAKTLCTDAINKAIGAAAQAGGGTVYLPTGTWLSGTIILKSHVTLHLEQGCTILGSPNLADYPVKIPAIRSFTDNYTKRSLIYAEDLDRISIEGDGTINGNGTSFPLNGPRHDRPFLMRVIGCRDVNVEGVFMKNSAMWTHHYLACKRVRVTNIRVWGFANHNNDGINIDGCEDVIVSNSFIYASDDGITLKSTSDRPCQGVAITNCVVSSRSSPIKMGTESVGGFRDISITNCTVRLVPSKAPRIFSGRDGLTGIELLVVDGGHMERVNISNITIEGCKVPLGVVLSDRGRTYVDPDRKPDQGRRPVGTIKDISISNIIATGAEKNCGILITGLPGHFIENVSLSNITISNEGGCEAKLADIDVSERRHDYPNAAFFGLLPSYGLYARHIRGLSVSGLRLKTAKPDARHALVLDDVQDAELNSVVCMPAVGTNSLMRLSQTKNVLIRGSQPQSAEGAFLKVDGANSSNIALINNDFSQVERVVEVAQGVPENTVRQAGNLEPISRSK